MGRPEETKPLRVDAAAQKINRILTTKSSQSKAGSDASQSLSLSQQIRVKIEPASSGDDRGRASSVDTVIVGPPTPKRIRSSTMGSRASSGTVIYSPPESLRGGGPRGRASGGSRGGPRGGGPPDSPSSSSDSSPERDAAAAPQPPVAGKPPRKVLYKAKDGTMKKRYCPGETILSDQISIIYCFMSCQVFVH